MISSFLTPDLACASPACVGLGNAGHCAARNLCATQISQPCCILIASSTRSQAHLRFLLLASVLPLAFSRNKTCSIPLNNNSRTTRRRKLWKELRRSIATTVAPDNEPPVHRLIKPRPREDEVQDRPRGGGAVRAARVLRPRVEDDRVARVDVEDGRRAGRRGAGRVRLGL